MQPGRVDPQCQGGAQRPFVADHRQSQRFMTIGNSSQRNQAGQGKVGVFERFANLAQYDPGYQFHRFSQVQNPLAFLHWQACYQVVDSMRPWSV